MADGPINFSNEDNFQFTWTCPPLLSVISFLQLSVLVNKQ